MLPFEEEAIQYQLFLPMAVCSVQVAPLSVEVQIAPSVAAAASFTPSPEDAMAAQFCEPGPVRPVQVEPLSSVTETSPAFSLSTAPE